MKRTGCWIVVGLVLMVALLTSPIWLMGPAVFFDSERTIRTTVPSPDRSKVATVEELVVGGVPNIVVSVRDHWLPNWYLTGCVATSHYDKVDVEVTWESDTSLVVASNSEPRYWDADMAPFKSAQCGQLTTKITKASE